MITKFNDPFREYIQPTDVQTNTTVPVHITRIVKLVPQHNDTTLIDCGQIVGFETYHVKENIGKIKDMIHKKQANQNRRNP